MFTPGKLLDFSEDFRRLSHIARLTSEESEKLTANGPEFIDLLPLIVERLHRISATIQKSGDDRFFPFDLVSEAIATAKAAQMFAAAVKEGREPIEYYISITCVLQKQLFTLSGIMEDESHNRRQNDVA